MMVDPQQLKTLSPYLADYFAVRISEQQLMVNLPDGQLNSAHIEKSLSNIGIMAKQQSKISDLILPALLCLPDGLLLFISEKNGDNYHAIAIKENAAEITLTAKEIKHYQAQYTWYLSNQQVVEQRSDYHKAKEQHWLRPAFDEVKPFYLSLLLGSFAINLLALVIPLFTMNVYDRVVPNAAIDTLWVLAIGAFLAIVFDWFLKQARTQLADVAGRNIDVSVSSTLFGKIMGMTLENRPQSTGAYAKQLQDFDTVREFITSITLVSLIDLPFTLLFLGLIAWLGGIMVLIPMTTMLIIILAGVFLKNKLNRSVEEAAKLSTQKQAHLIEDLSLLVDIKQCNREGKSQRFWEQIVSQLADWQNQSRATASTLTHTVMTMQQITTIGLIIAGVYQIQAGNISMGALIAMVMISGRSSSAISQIASLILKYKQTTAAMESVKAILALPQENDQKNIGAEITLTGDIRINNLSFHYPEQKLTILDQINFSAKPNEKIGLYGKAGSGKSTLLALLAGQYQPTTGQIFYENIELKQWTIADIRAQSGWVAQQPSLFYGSVLENIVQNTHNIDANYLTKVLTLTGINQFIERLEAGLESQVGEMGRCLSGGQRQAVAIASALIKKPKVLFLDEPSSAMDETNERYIINTLKQMTNTTLFIASHKPAVLAGCDKILVLENGKLSAIKTPAELFGMPKRKLRTVSIKPTGESK